MKCKIAVASTDGKVVNQHFGKAKIFYVIEADMEQKDQFEVVEIRQTSAFCEGGEHSDERLKKAIQKVRDCDYLLVSRIGYRAESEVESAGIRVFELPGVIHESVKELLDYIEIQEMIHKFSREEEIVGGV